MIDEVPLDYADLHIHLLGGFSLVAGDTPITSIEWPRLQSLLAYLVLHRHSRQSRTHLACLLWPDSTETQAHTNLRTLLSRLRRALPNADDFLCTDRHGVQWQSQPAHASWTVDVLDEEAITYYRRAAEAACNLSANVEALALYKRALLLLETAYPAANKQWRQKLLVQLHEGMGDVLTLTGHHSEARTAYQSSLALLSANAGIWQARLHRKIGQTLGIQEQFDQEWQAYDQAEAALACELPGRTPAWSQAWIDIQLSRIERSYYRSQIQEMTERIEQTRPVVRQYGLPAQRTDFLSSLWLWSIWRDWCDGRRERYMTSEESLGYAQALLAARLDTGNDREIGWARFYLGVAYLWHGDLEEAEEQLHTALALGERTGDVTLQARCLGNVIYVYRNRAQVEETRRAGLRALAIATEIGMPYYIGMAKANLAWVAWREGNLAEARELGHAALALWSQSSIFMPVRWTALWPLICTELAQERLSEAMAYARMLQGPAQHLPPEELSAIVEAALAKWGAGQQDTARMELEQATVMAQQMGYL
jgi:tetratricopeptide (TPR) repeat protein